MKPVYFLTVFLGSYLLFVVQPIFGKLLLPVFGGSYLVWGAAMVFFQSALLGGYLYSHYAQRWLGVRRYAHLHFVVLLIPFFWLRWSFREPQAWDSVPLAMQVFGQLFLMVGVPFLVVSMTSLLLQRWIVHVGPAGKPCNPYVLYAASNTGSVLALLSYPLVVEPLFALRTQIRLWWLGYVLLVLLMWFCMPKRGGEMSVGVESSESGVWRLGGRSRVQWFALSLATGTMLVAVTNVLTFDVASVPLLWVLPLALFMLAFVLTFKQRLFYPAWMESLFSWLLVVGLCVFLMSHLRVTVPPALGLVIHLLLLFAVCMHCNARLIQTRPADDSMLTVFYVMMALGGLCGSLLVSWLLPVISHDLVEYPLGMGLALLASASVATGGAERKQQCWRVVATVVGVAVLLCVVPRVLPSGWPDSAAFAVIALPMVLLLRSVVRFPLAGASLFFAVVLMGAQVAHFSDGGRRGIRLRNYYGIYRIFDRDGIRYLQHGTTQHGRQYLTGPKREVPLSYFHPSTPAAEILQAWQPRLGDVAIIGLGTGSLAAYAAEGQRVTFYELDPDNHELAERYFGYLEQARAQGAELDFVFGDGRVALRERADASLDLLILDAFNSGSIPVHLLTVEAIGEYMRVIKPDGLLLLHVSNKVLTLEPVVYANAREAGLLAAERSNLGRVDPDADYTVWMALSRDVDVMAGLARELGWVGRREGETEFVKPWTDHYSNLAAAVRWW